MLAKLTSWLFFLSIAASGLIDQSLFPTLGLKYITPPRLIIVFFIASIWTRLLIDKHIKSTFKALTADMASRSLILGLSMLMILMYVANMLSTHPSDGLSFILRWVEMAAILTSVLLAVKAGYLLDIDKSAVIASIIIAHFINICFAVYQITELAQTSQMQYNVSVTGTHWYPQAFSIFSAMVLSILVGCLDSDIVNSRVKHIIILSMIVATCFILPFGGSRMGTISLSLLMVLWLLLSPRTFRFSLLGVCLLSFMISNVMISSNIMFTTPNSSSRAIEFNNASTHARYHLLLTDLSLIYNNPITGIGLGSDNYKEHALQENIFHDFSITDPFVAEKPFLHSGIINIAVCSGIPSFIFYFVAMSGILVILWRSSVWSVDPVINKSFLASFIVFQSGMFIHPLYGELPWLIVAAGIVIAHKSMPRNIAVFAFQPLIKASLSEIFSSSLDIFWRCKKFFRCNEKQPNPRIISITFLGFIGLGDWLVVLPVLDAFRKKYPDALFNVLTNQLGAQTLTLSSAKTRPVILPDFPRGVFKFFRIISWLSHNRNKLNSDLLVSLWWHPTHQFLACLLPFKYYYGFFTCGGSSVSQLHNRIHYLESNIFQVDLAHVETDWFGNIRKTLVSGMGGGTFEYQLLYDDTKFKRGELRPSGHKLIVCQPNCSLKDNAWNIEKWAQTLLAVHKGTKVTTVLIGGAADLSVCNDLSGMLNRREANIINLCGRTSISQLAGLLKTADLFIGTDSGPGHLAAAVNTPSVLLYGPTRPENYLPVGFRGNIIYHKVECSPCGSRYCLLHGNNRYMCMNRISPEEVAESALNLVNSHE